MKHYILGLFSNSHKAGSAIAQLHEARFTSDISVLAKDWDHTDAHTHTVKVGARATKAGAVSGAVIGGVAGVIAAISSVVVPGVGTFLIGGPLLTAWGITGAATGALAGGIVGALVDTGIPEEKARRYEAAVGRGEVLVLVSIEHEDESKAVEILHSYDALETDIKHQDIAIA